MLSTGTGELQAGGGTASAGIPATLGGQPVGLDAGGRISFLNGNTFQYYKLNHRLQAILSATQKDSYSYDSLERLAQIESGAPDGTLPITERLFIYSGLDDSASAIATATKEAPTPSSKPAPAPPNPQTTERFIYDGMDHPLALPDPYPTGLPVPYNRTVYYEIDAIGNVRHLHGTAGGVDARDLGGYSYTAFGKTIPPTQPGGLSGPEKDQSLRWQGRPKVGPNLYDFRARVWSADLGAFLQPDEYGFLTPSGTLWSWPGQNPYRWRDPSGRFLDGAAAAAADAAAEAALAAASAGAAGTAATVLAGVAAVGFVGYAAYDIYNQINDFKHPIITHADPSKSSAGKEPCPDAGGNGAKKPPPRVTPGPAPGNYRGRYNADRASRGLPRLPSDYDAHHRIPQTYRGHPEFEGFDFDAPQNIRGVAGSRSEVNVHQEVTNQWSDFQRWFPDATRVQIEAFADVIDLSYGL